MSRHFDKMKGSRGRHPSHLKGKDIGLFYARRQKEIGKCKTLPTLGTILIPETKCNQIMKMLQQNTNLIPGTSNNVRFKRDFGRLLTESIAEKLEKMSTDLTNNLDESTRLANEFMDKVTNNKKYGEMLKKRERLPAYTMKNEIIDLVEKNQVVVISGETGCGKTTQVAQFILDDYLLKQKGSLCRIVCTQPRRISAITVAERVAEERGEALGKSVGYQIRLEKELPNDRGSICFMTTGVILKLMEKDPSLAGISHLILDEIHERDVLCDFLLALIKQVIKIRTDLKIILMSATLNAEKFSQYYYGCPCLNIPGFTYPVEEFYLEDILHLTKFEYPSIDQKKQWKLHKEHKDFYDKIPLLLKELEKERKHSPRTYRQLLNPESEEINLNLIHDLLVYICENKGEGAILVFLTGFVEISQLNQQMEKSGKFPKHRYTIFPLHSLMPTAEQKQIFLPPPPGKRKIVISTNIAETSITIDDVVFVVDCGKIKMSNFDVETNTQTLLPEWVSLANANQRKGRAGRVQSGYCYHLFTRARRTLLDEYQKPEILRKRLEDVILTLKVLQLGKVEIFFAQLLDKPDEQTVELSLELLKQLNALDDDENLTPLGYHLAKLPMAPQMGKMILFGAIFSCLDPILSIAASLDFKDAFLLPMGKEKEVKRKKLDLLDGLNSDHLLYHVVLKQFETTRGNCKQFCWDYYLSWHTLKLLKDMKRQFMDYLVDMRFVDDSNPNSQKFNRNSENISLVKAIICAGLYPNVAVAKKRGQAPLTSLDAKKLSFHPKSVLADKTYFEYPLLVYYQKLKSSKDFIHEATMIHPLPVVFFGDKFSQEKNMITINDHKIRFKCRENTGVIIRKLRQRFDEFLEYKITHPGPVDWNGRHDDVDILRMIVQLITWEEMGDEDDQDFAGSDDEDCD